MHPHDAAAMLCLPRPSPPSLAGVHPHRRHGAMRRFPSGNGGAGAGRVRGRRGGSAPSVEKKGGVDADAEDVEKEAVVAVDGVLELRWLPWVGLPEQYRLIGVTSLALPPPPQRLRGGRCVQPQASGASARAWWPPGVQAARALWPPLRAAAASERKPPRAGPRICWPVRACCRRPRPMEAAAFRSRLPCCLERLYKFLRPSLAELQIILCICLQGAR